MADSQEVTTYRAAWRERRRRQAERNEDLRLLALAAAHQLAEILKEQGAARVWAFGSVLAPGRFDARSDLDLAVEGIPPLEFYRAYGRALAALELPLELDLSDLAELRPDVREHVLDRGLLL